jgi:hypothetical protein
MKLPNLIIFHIKVHTHELKSSVNPFMLGLLMAALLRFSNSSLHYCPARCAETIWLCAIQKLLEVLAIIIN